MIENVDLICLGYARLIFCNSRDSISKIVSMNLSSQKLDIIF